jgi:ABC-type sugar transport system ATPase subunit
MELTGLRKEYRRFRRPPVVALDGVDLSVPDGGVFGFLGPNGSGKTTTIRCLLALARPSAGGCQVLGVDSQTSLPRVIGRIGSMVETPGLFPAMTGRRNLALLGRIEGIGPSEVTPSPLRPGPWPNQRPKRSDMIRQVLQVVGGDVRVAVDEAEWWGAVGAPGSQRHSR